MIAEEVVVWMRIVAVFAVAVAASPLFAMRALSSTADPSTPYRGGAARDEALKDRTRATLAILGGVVHLALIPASLLGALVLALRWSGGGADQPLIVLCPAIGALFVAPMLLVAASHIRSGEPTARMQAIALALFEAMLLGSGAWAFAYDPASATALATGIGLFALFSVAAVSVLLPARSSDDAAWRVRARERSVRGTVVVALFLGVFAVGALWVGDELGDRLSNHRSPALDAWYRAVRPTTFGLGAVFGVGCIVDVALAIAAARRGRQT